MTLTLWTLMMLPQSSIYCLRSFSWRRNWDISIRRLNDSHTHTLTLTRYIPGTQTQESGTCQCGWCHGEWRCLHVSSLSVETLKETDTLKHNQIKTTFRLRHSLKIIQQTNRLIITYKLLHIIYVFWWVLVGYLLGWLCRVHPPHAPDVSLSEQLNCLLTCFDLWTL